jgi:ANTAR domain
MFVEAAEEDGTEAVFALPLQLGAIRVGVLYLTRSRPGPLSSEGFVDALTIADMATVSLLDHQGAASLQGLGPPQEDGWAHRALVHQAAGMVAAQLDCGLPEAMARLRSRAFGSDRSLYEVATEVVTRRLRFRP